jgi:hypothetical protein
MALMEWMMHLVAVGGVDVEGDVMPEAWRLSGVWGRQKLWWQANLFRALANDVYVARRRPPTTFEASTSKITGGDGPPMVVHGGMSLSRALSHPYSQMALGVCVTYFCAVGGFYVEVERGRWDGRAVEDVEGVAEANGEVAGKRVPHT